MFQHAIPQSVSPQNAGQSFDSTPTHTPISGIYYMNPSGNVGLLPGKSLGGDAPGVVGGLTDSARFTTRPLVSPFTGQPVLIQNGMVIPIKTTLGGQVAGTMTKQFGVNLISPLGP